MRFLTPVQLREFEQQADDVLRGRTVSRYERCAFEIIDVDETVKIEAGTLHSDTLLLTFQLIEPGKFLPNPITRLAGVEVIDGTFIDSDASEAAAEELRAYRRMINPPREFKRIEANEEANVTESVSFGFDEGDEREDRLSPEVRKEVDAFAVELKEFRATHVPVVEEFRETPDLWEPDTFNPPSPMASADPLRSKLEWSPSQMMSKNQRERLQEEMQRETAVQRERDDVARINEIPYLLRMSRSAGEWATLRCEQLMLCGLSHDKAIQRTIEEASSGCLGHVRAA